MAGAASATKSRDGDEDDHAEKTTWTIRGRPRDQNEFHTSH